MEERGVIRVLVVDDHPAWRSFVVAHVQQHSIEIVGTSSDGVEAIQAARLLKPDVILIDVWIPRLSGLQVTRVICDADPGARGLVVTNESDPMAVEVALGAGALGYMLKRTAAIELLEAIDAVFRGKRFLGQGVVEA